MQKDKYTTISSQKYGLNKKQTAYENIYLLKHKTHLYLWKLPYYNGIKIIYLSDE